MGLYRGAVHLAILIVSVWLMPTFVASGLCFKREACGDGVISRIDCEAKGCCWDDALTPRCFAAAANDEICEQLKMRDPCSAVEFELVEIQAEGFAYDPDDNTPGAEGFEEDEGMVEVVVSEGFETFEYSTPTSQIGAESEILMEAETPQAEESATPPDQDDLESQLIDGAFADGSVEAQEMEEKTMIPSVQPVIEREETETATPKSDVVCAEYMEGRLERIGWLVLVKEDEPIELFTLKKESTDDSDNTHDSASFLKSPREAFEQASIEDAAITTERPSDFFQPSDKLSVTHAKHAQPSSHDEDQPSQVHLAGSSVESGTLYNTNHKGNEMLADRSMTVTDCSTFRHTPCGNGKMTKAECTGQGCCWLSLPRNLFHAGCYLPQSESEADTFDLDKFEV